MYLVYTKDNIKEIAANEGHAHILSREGFVLTGEFATLDEAMGVTPEATVQATPKTRK